MFYIVVGEITSRSSDGRIPTSRTNSSGSHKLSKDSSSPSFPLPVYTTRQGTFVDVDSPRKLRSDPSTSTEFDPSSSSHPYTSGGSSGFDNRSSASSSNNRNNLLTGTESTQTSQMTMKNQSTDTDQWASQVSSLRRGNGRQSSSSDEDDYAVPPDAYSSLSDGLLSPVELLDMNRSTVSYTDTDGSVKHQEKSGYLNQLGDSRAKSWKRRWFHLSNGELKLFKSKTDKQPLSTIPLVSVSSVKKVQNKAGNIGFELICKTGSYSMTGETPSVTQEWVKALQSAQKAAASHNLLMKVQTAAANPTTKGWVTKVKYGHSKRLFAMLIDNQLAFFKNQNTKVPISQLQLIGCEVKEVRKESDDSGSDDCGRLEIQNGGSNSGDFSIQIQPSDAQETTYLVLEKREDKERWFYHLKLASRDGAMCGTPFEILVQGLIQDQTSFDSKLWSERVFNNTTESIKTSILSLDPSLQQDAISLYKSSYLFTTVPMQASAIQYHIDLAQNVLGRAMEKEELQNESIAQLIKLSGSDLTMKLQAWKLLALALSLYLPTKYVVLWMLKRHLDKWSSAFEFPQSSLSDYCKCAIRRTADKGSRREPPSRLEALSLFTKNPSEHSLPHSIPIILPDQSYHVICFDGSSTVQEILEELCCTKCLRHPLYSGFTLHSDDPLSPGSYHALGPKQKLCDVISQWEKRLKEGKMGKVPAGKVIQLFFRQRFYWPHLSCGETEKEKIFRAYCASEEIKKCHIPISPELGEELCALMAQMHYGDFVGQAETDWYEEIVKRFYPEKLLQVVCKPSLKNKLAEHWRDLKGSTQSDCARVLLGVLRRWQFFGSHVFLSSMRWRNEDSVWIAVNDSGVHLLAANTPSMTPINSYPYNQIQQFGGCREDFMLTVSRPTAAPGDPGKERMVFAMPKEDILALTLLIKDYIKIRKVLSPGLSSCSAKRATLSASPRRSPRKCLTNSSKKSDKS